MMKGQMKGSGLDRLSENVANKQKQTGNEGSGLEKSFFIASFLYCLADRSIMNS